MKPLVGESLVTESQFAKLTQSIPRLGTFLEIGTWHGVTAAKLADDHPDAIIISVDPFIGYTGVPCDPNFYVRNRRDNMRCFVGTVQQLIPLWDTQNQFDVAFVDAVHKYPDALSDLMGASALLADGGRIFVHDYDEQQYPGVVQSVEAFCRQMGFQIVSRTDERRSLVELACV